MTIHICYRIGMNWSKWTLSFCLRVLFSYLELRLLLFIISGSNIEWRDYDKQMFNNASFIREQGYERLNDLCKIK